MKKICIILALIFLFCACGTEISQRPEESKEDIPVLNGFSPDFKPSDFENEDEYYEAFLDEYVKNLEPLEFFETEKEYPEVILEIFDIIMEEETLDFLKCKELFQIEVFGDENEFYTKYFYVTNEGAEEVLSIRVGKAEDGRYGLLLRGGGAPGGHGLEKTDITLEEIIEFTGQLEQITNDFEPDIEKLNYLVCVVPGVRSVENDEPWGIYKGFTDTAKISSDGLINFFFIVANPDDYYNEADETYRFSEDDVFDVLSEYFTDFNFNAKESGFTYDEENGFVLSGFCGHDLPKASFKIDEYTYDEETGIISVKGNQMELGDDDVPSGNTFSMEVLVEDGKYLIKSYFYNPAEK